MAVPVSVCHQVSTMGQRPSPTTCVQDNSPAQLQRVCDTLEPGIACYSCAWCLPPGVHKGAAGLSYHLRRRKQSSAITKVHETLDHHRCLSELGSFVSAARYATRCLPGAAALSRHLRSISMNDRLLRAALSRFAKCAGVCWATAKCEVYVGQQQSIPQV
jgi:hypothetical protein